MMLLAKEPASSLIPLPSDPLFYLGLFLVVGVGTVLGIALRRKAKRKRAEQPAAIQATREGRRWFRKDKGSKMAMSTVQPPPGVQATSKIPIVGGKIPFEMTRLNEDNPKDMSMARRIVLLKGKVGKGVKLFAIKSRIPTLEKLAYFVDLRYLWADGKLRFDEQYSEPIDPNTGIPARSPELSLVMANSFMSQDIKVATIIGGFFFNRQYLFVMLIAAMIGVVFITGLDPLVHIIPTVHITWVPQVPRLHPP